MPKSEETHSKKCTIGLCVKNDEASIKSSLNSILRQDFPHNLIELIVVDGKSEDNTLSIIKKKLSNSDLKFSIFQESKGLAFARQTVVDNSKGEYIIWIDGDMLFPNDYIHKLVKLMDSNKDVGIAGGILRLILPEVSTLIYKLNYLEKTAQYYTETGEMWGLIGTGGSIFRTEAVRAADGFDIKITGAGEDLELAHRMKMNGWKLQNTRYVFYDVPESDTGWKGSWKTLWRHWYWYGYNYYYIYHKHPEIFNLFFQSPVVSFLTGIRSFFSSFKLTHDTASVLLPLFFFFRQTAWMYAFTQARKNRPN